MNRSPVSSLMNVRLFPTILSVSVVGRHVLRCLGLKSLNTRNSKRETVGTPNGLKINPRHPQKTPPPRGIINLWEWCRHSHKIPSCLRVSTVHILEWAFPIFLVDSQTHRMTQPKQLLMPPPYLYQFSSFPVLFWHFPWAVGFSESSLLAGSYWKEMGEGGMRLENQSTWSLMLITTWEILKCTSFLKKKKKKSWHFLQRQSWTL